MIEETMKFLNDMQPPYELTFNDVFMVPSLSTVASRMDVDLTTPDDVGTTIPIVVANMNAVAGKRMAETVARRGGITVLPQDMPEVELEKTIQYIQSRHTVFETPVTLTADQRIQDALGLIHKRSHGAVIIVDANNKPIAGATSINDFYAKAIIGVQSAAGFSEGKPVSSTW